MTIHGHREARYPTEKVSIGACHAGHRVAFSTATGWVARLADAHYAGRLQDELVKLGRVPTTGNNND